MLQKTFYKVQTIQQKTDDTETIRKFSARVEINPSHPIFDGHFPGNPVVPGVCQIEIIREIAMEILKKPVLLCKSDNIKFLSMINPLTHPLLDIDLDMKFRTADATDITAVIRWEMDLFMKFKGMVVTELNG